MTEQVQDPDPAATPDATTTEEDAPTVPAKVEERQYQEGDESRVRLPQPGRRTLPGVHTRSLIPAAFHDVIVEAERGARARMASLTGPAAQAYDYVQRAALTMPPAEVADALGAPGLEHRRVLDRDGRPLELRVGEGDDDGGTFEGYACVWGVTDAYGTTFARGCFRAGGLDEEPYALLWMHDPWQVLGIFTATEDDHGLKIAGRWDQTPEGQAARAKAASGSAPELSVGFVPVMVDPDDENLFTSTRLVETSQITRRMAAVPGASITGSRATPVKGRPGEDPEPDDAAERARARAVLLLSEVPVGR